MKLKRNNSDQNPSLASKQYWMRIIAWAVLFLGVRGYLITCYQLQKRIVDDAFISFRFARNLAEGHGLVWNIGGQRVEGYTNAMWVFILAGIHSVGLDIETIYPWLGIAATLLCSALLVWIARRHLSGMHPWRAVFIAFYLTDRYTAVHSVSGMETQLTILLLCAITSMALVFISSPRASVALLLAGAIFACVLSRQARWSM